MLKLDIKQIEKDAQAEITSEAGSRVKERLKQLYRRKAKSILITANIEKEIQACLATAVEDSIYDDASIKV